MLVPCTHTTQNRRTRREEALSSTTGAALPQASNEGFPNPMASLFVVQTAVQRLMSTRLLTFP